MATKLTKMKIKEVSLVSRPAIAKEFLLFKSMDGETMDTEEIIKADATEEVVKADTEEIEKGKKGKKEPKKPVEKEAEVEKAKEGACKECKKMFPVEELSKEGLCKECAGKVKKEEEPVSKEAELIKSLEIEKAALASKVAELEKQAFEAKQMEITKEFIAKADKELRHVPTVIPSKFGPVLKSAFEKLTKEEYDTIYGALVGAEAIIKGSPAFKELGVGGEDLSSEPSAQLDAIAKSYQEKDTSLTFAKAYEQACMNNPAIYAAHVHNARRQ